MSSDSTDAALVLFSGGQDSTVCLAWALERFTRVETVGFDYGQRHRAELDARKRVRERMMALRPVWAERLGEDHLVRLDALAAISETALTRDVAIEIGESVLPTTFVPGRNLVFLAFAGALAYRRGLKHLVAGMCETDFSGYPRLPRRHDQGHAARTQSGDGAPLRDRHAGDVAGQGGSVRARA
jgi:7-cyano-7-deazaguanine synthase